MIARSLFSLSVLSMAATAIAESKTPDMCGLLQGQRKVSLVSAMAKVSRELVKGHGADLVLPACPESGASAEVLARNGIPEVFPGATIVVLRFEGSKDGKYVFALSTADDPFLDGMAAVNHDTGTVSFDPDETPALR